LAEFLIQTGGRREYVEFLGDGLQSDNWQAALQRHYGIQDLSALQNTWLAWIQQGMPPLRPRQAQPLPAGEMLAANERRPRPDPNLIYRTRDKQSPVAPLADLVPVRLPSSNRSASPTRAAMQWTDPSRVSSTSAGVPIVTADSRARPTALPASGWRIAGSTAPASPATPPSADPSTVQVTHPQPMEQPRQTVLQ
jgi:hypothetical protein